MIKAAEKIPANFKDEITVFSTTVTEKDKVDLHTDVPKIKMKNLGDFYAAYYSLIVCFSGKYFPKLSDYSSKLVMVRLGEFIINAKKENRFQDAVFTWNLSDKEIAELKYLGGYVIHNLYKNLEFKKIQKR